MDEPKCPLTEEWIKTVWHTHTLEYHPAIKKKEIMPLAERRDGRRDCHETEWSESEKDKNMILLICVL